MDLRLYGISARNDGFGVAGRKIIKSLENLGHNIDQTADIALTFSQPHQFNKKTDFHIGYFPWESTEPMKDNWIPRMTAMDELWCTSPWQQSVVEEWGFESYLYEHGIDPIWRPKRRTADDKVRFLFMGLEALRKGGLEAIRAFNIAFQGIDDVELVIKTQESDMSFPSRKIEFINADLTETELVKLYHDCHVFVAPTWGEGFGLPARDAAGTGMPVIATSGFLPYEDLLHTDLMIPSTVVESPWPDIHPGNMFQPDLDSLVDIYRDAYDNFSNYANEALLTAPVIHKVYNWDELTNNAFLALEQRLG